MNNVIGFIGGDKRNSELLELFKKNNFKVNEYVEDKMTLKDFFNSCDCIIAGTPFLKGKDNINAPNLVNDINVNDFFSNMKKGQLLIAGSIHTETRLMAEEYGIKIYDFLDDEAFTVLNVIPTAEGAIEIAMNKSDRTINASNCLVLGYGRIGKVLSDLLNGLHANVTVTARKAADFAWANSRGYKVTEYSKLNENLGEFDIIFNTVPAMIMTREKLKFVRNDCLIIDLASSPGGIDFEYARENGIDASLASGLPGKVAPKSVAEYMFSSIIDIFKF